MHQSIMPSASDDNTKDPPNNSNDNVITTSSHPDDGINHSSGSDASCNNYLADSDNRTASAKKCGSSDKSKDFPTDFHSGRDKHGQGILIEIINNAISKG